MLESIELTKREKLIIKEIKVVTERTMAEHNNIRDNRYNECIKSRIEPLYSELMS